MIKGFIDYREGKIPFVIENYRMELFTDDDLLSDFSMEHNFKKNYILHGQCLGVGSQGQTATFLWSVLWAVPAICAAISSIQ